eukprot:jgi/Bigna1/81486/fgenesh1_pg.81_\
MSFLRIYLLTLLISVELCKANAKQNGLSEEIQGEVAVAGGHMVGFAGGVLTLHSLYSLAKVSTAHPLAPVAGAASIACASIISCNVGEHMGTSALHSIRSAIGLKAEEGPRSRKHGADNVHLLPIGEANIYYGVLGLASWWAVGGTLKMALPSDLRLGQKYGCHTCGYKKAATFIGDHMPPVSVVLKSRKEFLRNMLNLAVTQRFYPQCEPCSNRQGLAVLRNRATYVTHKCGGLKLLKCGGLISAAQSVESSQIGRSLRNGLDSGASFIGELGETLTLAE